jgi:RimJ/RimL family protein N-acetyltransferase
MRRFSIRPYLAGDVDAVFEAASESIAHVSPWMSWLTPTYARADAECWVNKAVSEWSVHSYEHLIIDDTDGSIVGSCGLNHLDRVNRYCNLGYWVRSSRLQQGAARTATLLLRDFGFTIAGMNRLEIVVATGNVPSRKVAESVGGIHEGIQRKRLCVGEISYDAHMFALVREND